MESIKQKGFLSGNMLKIIAAVLMLIDHIGVYIKEYEILRIVGRLSFPVFAFMIAEGCHYTKNKLRYFLGIFLLGAVCQTITYLYDGSTYFCILITFSVSIVLIYALQGLKKIILNNVNPLAEKIRWAMLYVLLVMGVYFINLHVKIDYGFWGCMLAPLVSLFYGADSEHDRKRTGIIMLFMGLIAISADLGDIQWYSLLAVPLVAMYSGKRGSFNLKYFFYIFYPAHLAALHFIFEYIK